MPLQNLTANLTDKNDSFLSRLITRAISRFTFTLSGLRVDASGATLTTNLAANQTLATTQTFANVGSLGRFTQDGQSLNDTRVSYCNAYRVNIKQS